MAAAIRTRVVSWNEAADRNESVDSQALVIPSSSWLYLTGFFLFANFSLVSTTANLLTMSPEIGRASCRERV